MHIDYTIGDELQNYETGSLYVYLLLSHLSVPPLMGSIGRGWREKKEKGREEGRRGRRTGREEGERDEEGREKVDQVTRGLYLLH